MVEAKMGDTVQVHFTGMLEAGSVFARSKKEQPFQFCIGEQTVPRGFENAVIGMKPGETKTITIPPEEGYGHRHEELITSVDRNLFSEDVTPAIGKQLRMKVHGGNDVTATITDVTPESVTVDANHPLAGRTLSFSILLVDIC
jgi:peptidylprolyl isomerase/FKBP-type peptidyl-prolyl cis-trans isomerase SlpA